uniref:Peptidase S1 domain-containing protein n=1 Tax=Anopheles minimus TaxID=112268 RepID=A0A3F2Z0Z3_9DIPT
MYLRSVVVLLIAVLVNAESNVVLNGTYEACDGGFCMPKHLCPTGKADDGPILEQNRLVTVRVGEENECGDFMKICCKKSERKTREINYKCGISNSEGLVYNVESELDYAKYAEFPWTVAIFEKTSSRNNPKLTFVGGGSLIHPKFVVTTAHKLEKAHQYSARFGEWNMNSDAEAYPTQDIEIEEIIRHPSSQESADDGNDIALAVLEENVIYSEHIRPLCLPSSQDVFENRRCIASGWGVDVRTGQPPTVMKRMVLNAMSRKRCQSVFPELGVPVVMHRTEICAGAVEDQNTCFNDGGSPLACQRDDGSFLLAGMSSWVVNCDRLETPTGFVNVAKLACWINDTIDAYEESREKIYPILLDDNRFRFATHQEKRIKP